jgi:hypothetical protein
MVRRIAEESASLPRAWDGLVQFMTATLASQARDKSLRDVMIVRHQDLDTCGREKGQAIPELVQPLIHDLVRRAQQDGDLRPDVVPADIGVLLIAGVSMVELTAPVSPDVWHRHVSVILDGLRARPAGAGTPLTEPPLDDDQIDACMAGWKYGTRQSAGGRGHGHGHGYGTG